MRTSYSSIETYLQCPQRYKFQEIDRIRVPKSKEAIFGTLIHDTLKFMFQRDPLYPTLEEVLAYFRSHWPAQESLIAESKHDMLKRAWTEEEEKLYLNEGVRILKKFYEKNAPWNYTVIDLESHFEVTLTDEKTGEVHILAGNIDRIDKIAENAYEIIDYKTSKRMPSQDALNKNLQLSLYSLGLQKRWPHIAPDAITLSLYFVKHGEKLSTVSTKEATEQTKKNLLQTISKIQNHRTSEKPFETMPGPLCDWCGYKPMCPAWKHLYKNQNAKVNNQNEIEKNIEEYFALKDTNQKNDARLTELQKYIKEFMEAEGLTRVFGENGSISKKTLQRYAYDLERIKALLSPFGKWEEILKADETKIKKIMKEIPEDIRSEIEASRKVSKEYTVLTASLKKTVTSLSPENTKEA